MKILEYGDITKRKIILIHGFQCPYQVWNKYIDYYKNDFHIIVPIISGHNPAEKEDFVSFAHDAKQIEDFILSRYGNEIFAVYEMSMGGVLAATLWQNSRFTFEKVIFDGSPLVSLNCFLKTFMKKFYLNITHKTQKRDVKTVIQATKVIISKENLEHFLEVIDTMSDATIKNVIDDIASFKLNKNINTPNTNLYFFHGTAPNEMLAKKSAKCLKKYYENTSVKCFRGKFHCENALFKPEVMIEELDKVLLCQTCKWQ